MRNTSGFVRHSCERTSVRFPFTSLYHSGWSLKYFCGGRRELNVWHAPSPPPKKYGAPPYFSPASPRGMLRSPLRRRCAANATFCTFVGLCARTFHHDVERMANAGLCASSRSAGTTNLSRFGTTVRQLENQPTPPYVSSSSYTPYSTPRFPPMT